MRVAALHRYPLKGFSPEPQTRVMLEAGAYWPGDRLFAIENGPSGFDPDQPLYQPKIRFLMLMKQAELARLATRYDDDTGVLIVVHEGREVVRAALTSDEGRAEVARFLGAYVPADQQRGPLRLLTAPEGFRFTDSASGQVSLLNLASVAALEERLGRPVDPLRFRANIHLDQLPAWREFEMIGQEIAAPSGLRLRITKRIDRCAATSVDPVTGERDLPVVRTLMEAYGHVDCGVYAEIVAGGSLAPGQRLDVVAPAVPDRLGF